MLDLSLAFEAAPFPLMVVSADDPGFTVAAVNSAFLQLGNFSDRKIVGLPILEAFPLDPNDASSEGQGTIIASFRRVTSSRAADQLPPYRYDVEQSKTQGGGFQERWWQAHHTPVFDSAGNVEFILQAVEDITDGVRANRDAKKVARELEVSEERYRQIAETSGFGLVIAKEEGGLSYLNPALLQLLGYTEQDVKEGLVRWDELTPPEQASRDADAWKEVLATGKCAPYEKEYVAKDGRHIPILIGASLIDSLSGGAEVAAFVMDLTERKQNEQNSFLVSLDDATRPLLQPNDITQMAARMVAEYLDVNRCAYADVEEDENTFNLTGDYNRGVPTMVGRYTFAQFGGECLRLLRAGQPYVVEDSETDARCHEERDAYRAAQIRSVVCVPVCKAGRFDAAMAVHSIEPRRWKREEIELVLQVANRCWESIERSRVGRELQESEQRYHLLADSVPQMVWTATPDGELDYISDQAIRYFDSAPEALLGSGWLQKVHPDERESMSEKWRHSLQGGQPYDTSFRLLRASDQAWRWHLVRARSRTDQAGKIVQWVGTCTDVEDQKRAQAALGTYANELKRSNSDLEQFAHVASHDLRSPLNSVLNFSELLMRRNRASLDQQSLVLIDFIRTSATRMSDLISGLLAYSGLNDGSVTRATAVSSVEAYEGALANLRSTIDAAQAQVERDELPEVLLRKSQLVQVFQNLISNTIQYRGDAPPKIHVSAERRHDDGMWLFSVIDNGPGIAAQYHSLIFEPFKRLHGHERPGSGIGLAFCRKFIEREGGQIWVESEEGKGAAFRFTLPGAVSAL